MANRRCDSCYQKGNVTPSIHSVCYECKEFYCEPCSNIHLILDLSKNNHTHTVFDLIPRTKPPVVENEDELASDFSDFLKTYTAQVALDSTRIDNPCVEIAHGDSKTTEDAALNVVQCNQFTVKGPEEKKNVFISGVLTISDKIIVLDQDKKVLKVFNENGVYLSCESLTTYTSGITRVSDDTFATCGFDSKVYVWNLHKENATCSDVTYDVNYAAYGIYYNGTYYSVLHRIDDIITILDRQGREAREIELKEVFEKKVQLGWDIHMDSGTHDIHVPCVGITSGVLCMSVKGDCLWFTSMYGGLRGITEILGHLCVADNRGHCLHLLSKAGKYENKLLDKDNLGKQPSCVCYDSKTEKLYVTFIASTEKDFEVSVFTVT